MVKQLAHLCIFTPDLDRTAEFYVKGLGLTRQFDFVRDGQAFGYYLKLGANTFIEVFKGEAGEVGNINHLAIEVESLDEDVARLRSIGAAVEDKKMGADGTWQTWVTDPNGVRIELQEYTDKSLQLRGGTCIADW